MKNNTNLTEPKSLTRCGLWSLHKTNLVAWATSHCLLEHLSDEEIGSLTKEGLVLEILTAVLRIELAEEERAAATDSVARPVAELI